MQFIRHFGIILSFLVLCGASWSYAETIEAITKPNADVLLAFVQGGTVRDVVVKEGMIVKKGALLALQDDLPERLRYQQLREKAENTLNIEMVEVELAQKQEDLKKMEWAQQDGAVTDWELEHARLEVKTAELSRQLAIFENNQLRLQRDELYARIKQLKLLSPISGQIEEVNIENGEAAEPLSPVIRVVDIDPLRIDAQVPFELARSLAKNATVEIIFPDGTGSGQTRIEGKVQNIGAVADAASNTLRVWVEVPNASMRPAGERVKISF